MPSKQTFTDSIGDSAPTGPAEASERMASLRQQLNLLSSADRTAISRDAALMDRARIFVGDFEYMTLVAAVGMYVAPGPERAKQPDAAVHMSGAEADDFIRQNMASIGHLKGYIESAVGAGKKAEGYVAVVSDDDWKRIYGKQNPKKTVGVDDVNTNAFIANKHPDRPAIIHHDRGTRSTAIHESMHRYSELAVLHTYGSPLNEGITEYFTRLITDKDGNPVKGGKSNRTNYPGNWAFVCGLVGILGDNVVSQQTTLAEVYFGGKVALLRTKFVEACDKQAVKESDAVKLWSDLMDKVDNQNWRDAIAGIQRVAKPPQAAKAAPAAAPAAQAADPLAAAPASVASAVAAAASGN